RQLRGTLRHEQFQRRATDVAAGWPHALPRRHRSASFETFPAWVHNPNVGCLDMAEDHISIDRPQLRAERGVAQYQRLASLLRHRIAKGEYPLGAHLPPITQLAADLGVAVVTVRQAYELLSREGLIRSQRGVGTRVAALPRQAGDIELAINDLYAAPEELAFQILEIRQGAQVPLELLGPEDRAAADNVCIRKLHTYSGEPFCHVEIYIPAEVWRSLPKDVARKRKLLAAVLDA